MTIPRNTIINTDHLPTLPLLKTFSAFASLVLDLFTVSGSTLPYCEDAQS